MTRRTDYDFSRHEIKVTDKDGVLIHYFARPNTIHGSIKFINIEGIMVVTGDFGNWVFCRGFRPSPDGFVSDSYWVEKLRISSTQQPKEYDPDGTKEEIEKCLKEDDIDEADKEYLNDLFNYVYECEERYMVYAYDNLPKGRDHEYIPLRKKLNPQLEVVFDAFDEICQKVKQ